VTARLSEQTLLARLQQLSSSPPRSVPLPVTGYEQHLHPSSPHPCRAWPAARKRTR